MNQNQNNFTCPHCIALQRDFELLQSKEEKLRRKLKSLENLVHDLQLKNNLLEEENDNLLNHSIINLLKSQKSFFCFE